MSSPSHTVVHPAANAMVLTGTVAELDQVELQQLQVRELRRRLCCMRLPRVFLGISVGTAMLLTFLCINYLLQDDRNNNKTSIHASSLSSVVTSAVGSSEACDSDWTQCTSPSVSFSWCCLTASMVCGASDGSCDWRTDPNSNTDDNVNSVKRVGIIIACIFAGLLFGPAILYGIFIGFIRCSSANKFEKLRNNQRYESWIIMSGCFDMSIAATDGDNNEFTQAAFALASRYGGCGGEFPWHCLGCWFCGPCYPVCMCCVTADRNKVKIHQLESGLSLLGYASEVQFASNLIPACCNSIFVGKLEENDRGVVAENYNNNAGIGGYGYVANAGGGYPQYGNNIPQYAQPQYSQVQYSPPYSHQVLGDYPLPNYQLQQPQHAGHIQQHQAAPMDGGVLTYAHA